MGILANIQWPMEGRHMGSKEEEIEVKKKKKNSEDNSTWLWGISDMGIQHPVDVWAHGGTSAPSDILNGS